MRHLFLMQKPRSTIAAAAGLSLFALFEAVLAPLVRAGFKAIYDVEVQDAWKDGAHPVLAAAWSRAAVVLDFINNFWGGACSALFIVFCAEMYFLRQKRLSQMNIETTAAASKEQLSQIGRQCLQLSRAIQKEHARITARRIERQQKIEAINVAALGGFNWLQMQSDNIELSSEFSSEALVALHTLAIAKIHVPNFTDTENNMAVNQPIEQTIQYYLVLIAQYLGSVGMALEAGNIDLAQHISKRWGRFEKGATALGVTPPLQSLQEIAEKIQP